MNNLLKFLLTFALLLCAVFSVMLIMGCEETATNTPEIKTCEEGQIYNDIIGNCVLRHCQFDKYYSDEDAEITGFHGCYQGCEISLNNDMKCYYVLNQSEISDLKTMD